MDNYIVSARKYRPATFEDVVGQSAITSTLQKAIQNNHLAQALLFCGPRGVGKTTCARILAKAINIDDGIDENEDFSFNIFELDAASNNSVDDIRHLIDQVRFAPQQGNFKVYIIDEVHMLSQAAFNAFLKTLEEPPAHAIFILATTEKHKIIPTILSRCQIFDFKRIQISDMVSHLANIAEKESVTVEPDALHVIAEKADGALRDALSIFDRLVTFAGNDLTYKKAIENLNILDHDYYFRATDHILQGDMGNSMLLFNDVLENGFNGHEFINGLAAHFRNLLMCKDPATVKLLEVTEGIQKRYLEQAQQCSPLNLLKGLRAMNDCDVQYRASKNQRLTVELAVMRMCALHKIPEGAALVAAEKKKPLTEVVSAKSTVAPTESVEVEKIIPKENSQPESAAPDVVTIVEDSPNSYNNKEEGKPEEPKTISKEFVEESTSPSTAALPIKVRGKSSRGNSIRINDEPIVEEEVVDPTDMPKDDFDEGHLQKIWQERVNILFKGKKGLLSSLTKNKPTLKDDLTIELKLDGKHQLDKLLENRNMLIEAIRKDLNNYSVQLETPVTETITKKKAYTPKEVYQKMLEENPNLDKLRTDLNLDLEY